MLLLMLLLKFAVLAALAVVTPGHSFSDSVVVKDRLLMWISLPLLY
jgi:hypothetical protein